CYMAGAAALGFGLPRIELGYRPRAAFPFGSAAAGEYAFALSAASAQELLGAIALGMMVLAALGFSIAFISGQLNPLPYSPRLALRFARRPLLFHAFGAVAATSIHALTTLILVDLGGSGSVPIVSVLLASIFSVVSFLQLARLMHGLSELQVTNMVRAA